MKWVSSPLRNVATTVDGNSVSTPLSFPTARSVPSAQHPITQITEVVAVDPPMVKVPSDVLVPGSDRVNAREVPFEISQPVFPPNFGVRRPKEARNVLAVPSLDAALEDLDVLLRHRPPSIPRPKSRRATPPAKFYARAPPARAQGLVTGPLASWKMP